MRILIISNDLTNRYLDEKEFENIKTLLNKNVVVFFRTSDGTNSQKLKDLSINNRKNRKEERIGKIEDLEYIWIAKLKSDEFTTGEGYYQYNCSEEQKFQDMILVAWRWFTRDRDILINGG